MANNELPGSEWTKRWWRLPGENLLTRRVGDLDVSIELDYCHRGEWGFVFQFGGRRVQGLYDVDADGLVGVQAVPREIILVLLEQIRVRAKRIVLAQKPPDAILASIAARFAVSEWVTGRRLRREVGLDVSEFGLRIARLRPRFVRTTRRDDGDYYSLTLPGLMVCRDTVPAETISEALYNTVASRFNDDPDHSWFSASDLARFGITSKDLPLAKNIARTCLLVGGADDSTSHQVFGMPTDAETIAEQHKKGTRFRDYILHAANERRRSEHYTVLRPWLDAPFWIAGDGDQPDFVPASLRTIPPVLQTESTSEDRLDVPGFEILQRMAGGAGGEVHRARESREGGVERAIKVFIPHPFADEQEPEPRFRSEVGSLYRLQHRAIVRYVYAGVVATPRMFYLVMELVKGVTLTARAPSMSLEKRVGVVAEVLDGLEHAHANGVFHRDIKPSNIVIRESDDQPVLVDFGLAYVVGEEKDDDRTQTVMGTPGFIPPENYKNPKRSRDARHDIFQAGITLYVTLSGHLPPDTYLGIETVDPRLASLDPVVRRAIAADPDQRFGTAAAFAAALREWIEHDAQRSSAAEVTRANAVNVDFSRALELQTRQLQKEELEIDARRKRVDGAILVLAPLYEEIRSDLLEIAAAARAAGLPVSTASLINTHPVAISLSALKEWSEIITIFECTATPARGVPFTIALSCEYRPLVPAAWPLRFQLKIVPGPEYSNNDVIHLGDGAMLTDWAKQSANKEHFQTLLKLWLAEPAHWAEFDVT